MSEKVGSPPKTITAKIFVVVSPNGSHAAACDSSYDGDKVSPDEFVRRWNLHEILTDSGDWSSVDGYVIYEVPVTVPVPSRHKCVRRVGSAGRVKYHSEHYADVLEGTLPDGRKFEVERTFVDIIE